MGEFKTALRRAWYRFSRNAGSVVGLAIVGVIVLAALFAPLITPFPGHAGGALDILNANHPPDGRNLLGTDLVGRDLFTRIIYGYRLSLFMAVVVLALTVPVGVAVGLAAGYAGGMTEAVLMRITDVFLAVPPLVLAMAIMGLLPPSLIYGMMAVSLMWWPWYARLAFSIARSLRQEGYVTAAEVIGASTWHVLLREILPNAMPSILTKMTLDVGFVILIASSLSFLGLGVQPPTPDLGSMVAEGAGYLPDLWWLAVCPGVAILLVILGTNLLGDGIRDLREAER